jgi:4-hydroxy-tetrahydrodipicolinate reductase
MGTAIMRILVERGHAVAAAFDAPSAPSAGKDVGTLIGGDVTGVTVAAINEAEMARVEAVIDFSAPSATMQLLPLVVALGKPLVVGTTGFSHEQRRRFDEAARSIPLIVSPNMSVGVNVLFRLTEMAARVLGEDYDVEVFEAHHRFKKDAPSGTAKRLIEIVKGSSGHLASADETYDRSGIVGERASGEIGVQVLRGGDIVGEHTVYFVGMGERVELTHRAQSRDNLARGAVLALEYIAGKKPGFYSMFDVLGI